MLQLLLTFILWLGNEALGKRSIYYNKTCSIRRFFMCKRGTGGYCHVASMTLLLLVILTSCSTTTGIFGGGKWQSGGLQHQHLLSLVVDPNNPNSIYAGDAQDGIFVSTNAGLNWSQRNV